MKRLAPSLLLSLLLTACSGTSLPEAGNTPTTPVAPIAAAPVSDTPAPAPTPVETAANLKKSAPAPTTVTVSAYGEAQLVDMLGQLRITQVSGTDLPLAGAYRVAPAGRINWYFANLGLRHFIDLQPAQVREYLSTYIAFSKATSATYRIYDVNFTDAYAPAGVQLVEPDSDDAYAGTYLSLAANYVMRSGDQAWFKLHRDDLLAIAQANIIGTLKASGLPTVFQNPQQGGGVGYLMDACEAYDGLNALAKLLESAGDPAAPQVRSAAARVASGIATLFDTAQNRWNVADVPFSSTSSGTAATGLYPFGTAQVFAGVYNVPAATPKQTKQRAAAGWAALNAAAPQWASSTQYDAFPWVMLAYAATTQNQTDAATRHLEFVKQSYPFTQGHLTINELGFYRAAQQAVTQQALARGQQIQWQ